MSEGYEVPTELPGSTWARGKLCWYSSSLCSCLEKPCSDHIRDEGFIVELAESLMRPRWSAFVTRVPWLSWRKVLCGFDGRQFKSFEGFMSEVPGNIPLEVLRFRQKAVLLRPKSDNGQPKKPRCDIPPGPGARKRYDP